MKHLLIILIAISAFFFVKGGMSQDADCVADEQNGISEICDGTTDNNQMQREYFSDALTSVSSLFTTARGGNSLPVKSVSSYESSKVKLRILSKLLTASDNSEYNIRRTSYDLTNGYMNVCTSRYVTYHLGRIII